MTYPPAACLGSGDGQSETRLAGCLVEAGTPPELCLLDISPPLLTSAYHHAVSHLASLPQVHIWALQGNFHHLPLYAALHRPAAQPRRLITLLGERWRIWITSYALCNRVLRTVTAATCCFGSGRGSCLLCGPGADSAA